MDLSLPKLIIRFIILFSITFLINCKSTQQVENAPKVEHFTPSASSENVTLEDVPLILYIKTHISQLQLGMSKNEVENYLTLNKRFNGLIFSEGSKANFCYIYEIDNYELLLFFDYRTSAHGAFLSGQLVNHNKKITVNYP